MVGKQVLRTEVGERVDHPDFSFLSEVGHRDAVNQIMEAFAIGTDDVSDVQANTHPKFFVLSGFQMTVVGTAIRIDKDVLNGTVTQPGAAILAFRDGGTAKFGALLSGGDASKTIDITSYATGTYGIFVRFAFQDDTVQNRLFWNPVTPTPTETPRAIATRKSENWEVAVELVEPGPEWMRIGTVVRASMTLSDVRNFFFEGRLTNSYSVSDTEWGSTVDRNNDRALHGVSSVYKAVRGLQRQVQDIIGETSPAGWWRTIDKSLKVLLARDGSRSIQGTLVPDTTGIRALGSPFLSFSGLFSNLAVLGVDLLGTDADAIIARVTAHFSDAAGRERTLLFQSSRIGGSPGWPLRVYRAQSGLLGGSDILEFVWNASWNNATDLWTQIEDVQRPIKVELGSTGIALFHRDTNAGAGGTFAESIGGGGWEERGMRFRFEGSASLFHRLYSPILWARAGSIFVDDDEADAPLDRADIQLNALSGTAARRHALLSNYTAGQFDVRAGASGESPVRLYGTANKLGTNCQGQGGFYFQLFGLDIAAFAIPANGLAVVSKVLLASPAVAAGDRVVDIVNNSGILLLTDGLFIAQASMSGSNTLDVTIGNLTAVAKPAVLTSYGINVTILRKTTG